MPGIETFCESCGLVDEVIGLSSGLLDAVGECESCGGVRVVVESELLVDGSAGVLVDGEVDESFAAGFCEGWELRRRLVAAGVDPDSPAAVDLVVASMSGERAA